MFLIRQSKPEDLNTLSKLARMVYFINLPPDEKIIGAKVRHSQRCFSRVGAGGAPGAGGDGERPASGKHARTGFASTHAESDLFMFTIVDRDSGAAIGTSQIRARMGGPGNPNYAFKLEEREFFSESLNFGTTHTIGRLYGDETGPTEIGGLILQPSFRGHRGRPGRLIAFVRFHFMGLYRHLFAERVLAEMMAQVTADGDNLFWDAIGRKFIPVKYAEADRFCQHNRAFIKELLPKEDIYLTLLPLEILNTVGQVSHETLPARRMLEKLGFAFRGFIDPFDGGPHLDAALMDISLVKATRWAKLGAPWAAGTTAHAHGLVSTLSPAGEFRAVETPYTVDSGGTLRIPEEFFRLLDGSVGLAAGYTPLDEQEHPAAIRAAGQIVKPAGVVKASRSRKSAPARVSGEKPAKPAVKAARATRGPKGKVKS